MSEMPLNEDEDDDHRNKQVNPVEFQDKLIHVMQISLHDIAIQVHNLSNCADDLVAQLAKEADDAACGFMTLQKLTTKFMSVTTYKDRSKESPLQASKSETSGTALPTEQLHSSQPLPVKMYKVHRACGQTLPLHTPSSNDQDDAGLKSFADNSHGFEICKGNAIPESKGQKPEKLKEQQKHLYHPSESESVPLCQSMQNDVSVDRSQAACGESTHSFVHQWAEWSSFSTHPFSEMSLLLTRTVGQALTSSLHLPRSGAEDLKSILTYARYGIGTGEKVEPQPRIHHKMEVFVSPTVPPSAPPLPPNWSALLRVPKRAHAPAAIHAPSQFPSSALRSPTTSPPQMTPGAGLPISPPKVDSSLPVHKLVQYYEMVPRRLLPPDEERGPPPPTSAPPVISHGIDTKDTVKDQVARAPVKQSPASLVLPSARSSSAQSARPSPAKLARSSVVPTPRPSRSPPSRYPIPSSKSSLAPLAGHSTLKSSQSSGPLSLSSCTQASRSLIPSGKHSSAQSPRAPVAQARRVAAQSARSSVAPSKRSSVARSSRPLVPPQQRSSSAKSTRSFMLRSPFCPAQPPAACISQPQTLSLTQSSQGPVSPDIKPSPSIPTIFSKARSALMEAIRGILPGEAEDRRVLKAKRDLSKK